MTPKLHISLFTPVLFPVSCQYVFCHAGWEEVVKYPDVPEHKSKTEIYIQALRTYIQYLWQPQIQTLTGTFLPWLLQCFFWLDASGCCHARKWKFTPLWVLKLLHKMISQYLAAVILTCLPTLASSRRTLLCLSLRSGFYNCSSINGRLIIWDILASSPFSAEDFWSSVTGFWSPLNQDTSGPEFLCSQYKRVWKSVLYAVVTLQPVLGVERGIIMADWDASTEQICWYCY